MRDWLNRTLPAGPWHLWLVDSVNAAAAVVLAALMYFLLRWVLLRAVQTLMLPLLARAEREGETSAARLRTLQGLALSSITYTLLFVAVVTLLGQAGVNVSAILAGAGVAGLAFSFGAQRLVRDVLTGFFLLLEDQFRVGEIVTLIGLPGMMQANGTVLDMGLRTTRLRDTTGKLVTVSNGDIGAVVNHSRGPITAAVELGVPAEVAIDRIREIMVALDLPADRFSGPAELRGVTALEAGKVVVRIAAPAQPGKAPEAELALRQAAGEALRRAGVEIR